MRDDLDSPGQSELPSNVASSWKNTQPSIATSRIRDDKTSHLENNESPKWSSYSSSSETTNSPSSTYSEIPHELHVPADLRLAQRGKMAVHGLNLHQTQYHGLYSFNNYLSELLVHIYDRGKVFCISLNFSLQPHQYTNRLAKFAISVIFLTSAIWYLIPAFNGFFLCQLTGAFFSAKPHCGQYQQFGYHPCWFEESSISGRFAQVNDKLVNIADFAALEQIPLDLTLTQEKVAELYVFMRRSMKDPSAHVLFHLLKYRSQSILTRSRVDEFTRKLGLTMLRVYSTTQSTVDGLKSISKVQKNQAYLVWVVICILDNLFGGSPYWADALRCSTSRCASLFVKHVDEVIPNIKLRENDASRLVQSFGTLRGHLKGADEIQRQNQYLKMMEFYQAYETNQTTHIDPHLWTKLKAFLERKIWTRIKAFLVGKESTTTALETLAPETRSLQLILPFLDWAEEYFDQILSNLEKLEVELNQLRKRAEEQRSWTSIWCVFKKPPIRSWTRQLKSSFRIRVSLPKGSEGQRKIGMTPHVEAWG